MTISNIPSTAVDRYCTFWVGDQHYGLNVASVREVLQEQSTTSVPAASAVIGGLINLRGEIVTAVDLRCRLELPARTDEGRCMNIVVNLEDEVISLVVDAVGDVVDLPADRIEPVPDTVPAHVREVMLGVHRAGNGLIQILDATKLVPGDGTD